MVAPSGGGGVEGERTRVQCRLTRWHHASTAVAAAHGTDVTAGSLVALLSTSSGARSGRTAAGHGDPPHACCAPPRPAHPGVLAGSYCDISKAGFEGDGMQICCGEKGCHLCFCCGRII
ncbi:hypothetical protein SETIT_9G379500v2 [Setaria italica]|uniref:Uncharacterized protein n=1 Tax=Setaria italica TaxID=4555 RepID=A0A368SQ02_SETIT|nr:hypothetical protein SETIT_9G379500v2 [Setaria italica]